MEWQAAFAVVGWLLVLWTVLPVLRHDVWWVRGFEFPRIQIAVLTAAALVVQVGFLGAASVADLALAAALAACIAWQLVRISPYCALYPKQMLSAASAEAPHTLGIVVANVFMPNRNAAGLLSIVQECDPDLVLTLETDHWWQQQLAVLDVRYPHSVKHPLENTYGMHLYSRLELIDPQVAFLVEEQVPSIHTDVVLRSGHRVELHCLHPAPPSPTENPTSAERDAELLVVARSVDVIARSVVVTGDLNDVAWSATTRLFQRISGLLDPRIGRGVFNTFHARYPLLRWPLDHVFASPDFTLVHLARLPPFGSDHFAIHAVLRHQPRAQAQHDMPVADAADREQAAAKIQKVDPAGAPALAGTEEVTRGP